MTSTCAERVLMPRRQTFPEFWVRSHDGNHSTNFTVSLLTTQLSTKINLIFPPSWLPILSAVHAVKLSATNCIRPNMYKAPFDQEQQTSFPPRPQDFSQLGIHSRQSKQVPSQQENQFQALRKNPLQKTSNLAASQPKALPSPLQKNFESERVP